MCLFDYLCAWVCVRVVAGFLIFWITVHVLHVITNEDQTTATRQDDNNDTYLSINNANYYHIIVTKVNIVDDPCSKDQIIIYIFLHL